MFQEGGWKKLTIDWMWPVREGLSGGGCPDFLTAKKRKVP